MVGGLNPFVFLRPTTITRFSPINGLADSPFSDLFGAAMAFFFGLIGSPLVGINGLNFFLLVFCDKDEFDDVRGLIADTEVDLGFIDGRNDDDDDDDDD